MLPSDKSRRLTLNGVGYRWAVSEPSRLLFVTLADGTGSRLEVPFVVELPGLHWLPLPGASPRPTTPRRVAQLIEAARALGWRPEAPGAAFRFPAR